jgi:transcriptional regulator with XRE-family HTH domain
MMPNVKPGERDPELLKQLGQRLRAAREAAGLSQRELANGHGEFSYSWLQQQERGVRPDGEPVSPKGTTLLLLVRKLNSALPADHDLRVDEADALRLAGFDPTRFIDTNVGRPTVSVRAMAEKIGRLPEDELQALSVIVDGLLREGGHIPPEPAEPVMEPTPTDPAKRMDMVIPNEPMRDFTIRNPKPVEDRDPEQSRPSR